MRRKLPRNSLRNSKNRSTHSLFTRKDAGSSARVCRHIERLLGLGLSDAFRLFEQADKSFSWWDYRMGAFRRNFGLRIDHLLVSPALKDSCRACYVDKAPRKLERPSDHAPVVVELA